MKRPRILFVLSLVFLAAFEVGMTVYYFVTPARNRGADLVGEWIAGSAILISVLAYSMGEGLSDLIDLGTRFGRIRSRTSMWGSRRIR